MDTAMIATGNLLLQVFTLALLLAGFLLKRRRKLLLHGRIMLVAVVLNAVSFLLVMGPSLWNSLFDRLSFFSRDPLGEFSILTAVHAVLGTVAEVLGIWVVFSWRLSSSFNRCSRKKRVMRCTVYVWVATFTIGAVLYFLKYT